MDPQPHGCCRRCIDIQGACCCPSLRASFTSECKCWVWPRDHLLVNKVFREQALDICYTSNTFLVIPNQWQDVDDDQDPVGFDHHSALAFLKSMPKDALQYLRSLQVMFFLYADIVLPPGPRFFGRWREALEYIQNNMSIPVTTHDL